MVSEYSDCSGITVTILCDYYMQAFLCHLLMMQLLNHSKEQATMRYMYIVRDCKAQGMCMVWNMADDLAH